MRPTGAKAVRKGKTLTWRRRVVLKGICLEIKDAKIGMGANQFGTGLIHRERVMAICQAVSKGYRSGRSFHWAVVDREMKPNRGGHCARRQWVMESVQAVVVI